MKVIALPSDQAISLQPFFKMTCRSAMSRASAYLTLISSCPGDAVADPPHHAFFLGRLQDMIILDIIARRLEIGISLVMGALIALVEQEKLKLRRHEGLHLH